MSFHEGSKWQEMQEDNAKRKNISKENHIHVKDLSYTELMLTITKWSDKYEFSFQFWGKGQNNVFICKDDVDLVDFGGEATPKDVLIKAVEWINKVNR